jgi:hypothetical protein
MDGMFVLDEAEAGLEGPKDSPQQSPHLTSTPGCSTPSANQEQTDIAVQRRTIPVLEYSDDCCPVCLEDYEPSDPGVKTCCG